MWESTYNASARKVHLITNEGNAITREPGLCSSISKAEDCKGQGVRKSKLQTMTFKVLTLCWSEHGNTVFFFQNVGNHLLSLIDDNSFDLDKVGRGHSSPV